MIFSNEIDKIVPAFAKCRKMVVAPKSNKQNTHLRNHYADLNSVYAAIAQGLIDADLTVIQEPTFNESIGRDVCLIQTTILHNTSGQFMSSTAQIPLSKIDPQGFGSALTYGKRYALVSIFCLNSKDDDGNSSIKGQELWKRDIDNCVSIDDISKVVKEVKDTGDNAMFKVIQAYAGTRKAEIEHEQSTGFSAPAKREKKTVQQTEQQNNEQEDF